MCSWVDSVPLCAQWVTHCQGGGGAGGQVGGIQVGLVGCGQPVSQLGLCDRRWDLAVCPSFHGSLGTSQE